MTPFSFTIQAKDGRARAGLIETWHGLLETPVFAPVGTQAAVKALTPAQLSETGTTLLLANTYHLYLRPGADLINEMGGLHDFMQWSRPILTDSGGYQVFSLAKARKIDEDGVTFRSHIDGSMHRFTPERSIEVQQQLGGDIIMTFDECSSPYDTDYSRQAMMRTHAWAERCVQAHTRRDQALFGIVQGGVDPALREQSAGFISNLNLPGNAIGGLSVGETKNEMYAMLDIVNAVLPEEKPRYLMGVGSPEDLLQGILRGVDMFDCVLPTRLARHKAAFSTSGRINLINARYARDPLPIDEQCQCYTCQHFSRAYLRHLISARETLAGTLISIHNLSMLMDLMRNARQAIVNRNYYHFMEQFLETYQT